MGKDRFAASQCLHEEAITIAVACQWLGIFDHSLLLSKSFHRSKDGIGAKIERRENSVSMKHLRKSIALPLSRRTAAFFVFQLTSPEI